MAVGVKGVAQLDKGGGHKRGGDSVEEETEAGEKGRDGSTETAKTGEPATEPGKDGKGKGDEVGDPAEAPHVVVVHGGGAVAEVANDVGRDAAGTSGPSPADRRCRPGTTAVDIAGAADVEVGPLGGVAGALDALSLGFEEEGVVEGDGVDNAGEEDEEGHDDGSSEQDHASNGADSVGDGHGDDDDYGAAMSTMCFDRRMLSWSTGREPEINDQSPTRGDGSGLQQIN